MWDYDKLFAEGNVIGIKYINYIGNHIVPQKTRWGIDNEDWKNFWNNELKSGVAEIQYIIRLDEHGNVVERLFDREKDMKSETKPMPKLETGMFVRVNGYSSSRIGFVDAENNHVIYREGGYDFIDDDDINGYGIASKIVEVYDKHACAFDFCDDDVLIWRDPDYQAYLNSKNNP